ncbi:MAG: acetolactate synthase large subunit, partial [Alicyclobacillus sp.]|nr:acetolactate synthase large subunit [Alicyclobacillus sp.]
MGVELKQPAGVGQPVQPAMNGARMLVEALKQEQVDVIFGYPGGAVLTIYDALYDAGIRHVLTRHEQGSIHAAEGYARVTGKPGVVIATSGPGATNLVTGLADAMMDSLPLVVFTGQVATQVIGTDAFQEASIIGITMPITKHNFQVRTVEELPRMVKEAFHIAATGRPGPVLIDVPKDVTNAIGLFRYDDEVRLPGYQPTVQPHRMQIRKLVEAIRQAHKPVVLAGAGVVHARAHELLLAFVEKVQVPVVNTLLGLGSFPYHHPLFLGMGGMHGTYAANKALYEADLII